VHGSISSKYKWLNDAIGRISGIPLFSPFYAFQRLHLSHHQHTNDPEKDPDFWSGKGPWFLLPLRWLTQELYYWYISATKLKETSTQRKREVIFTLLFFYGASVGLAINGYSTAVIWAWIVPSRLASGMLAFLFDYLPHQPHRIPMRKDPFKATRNIEGRGLSLFFLSQNYHLVHHTFPTVPFYRYLRLWRRHRPWFEERGGQTVKPLTALRKK
jgi:fatty acid desaturase